MDIRKLTLKILPDRLAVCRFEHASPLPAWVDQPGFYSVTRTADELSVVCNEARVAPGTKSEPGWRCLQLVGPFTFTEIGIIASLTRPLAKNGVCVFVISTFDTDYLMVKDKDLATVIDTLRAQGHHVKA